MRKIFNILSNNKYATVLNSILIILGILGALWRLIPPFEEMLPKNNEQGTSTSSIIISKNTAKEKGDEGVYFGSIFDLAKKILSEKITIKKQEIINKSSGLYIQDSGYIIDITKGEYKGTDRTYTIAMDIVGDNKNKETLIQCRFTEDWQQTILSSDFSNKIKFSGMIIGGKNYDSPLIANSINKNIPLIYLEDCRLFQ